jgi:hypothetical protein
LFRLSGEDGRLGQSKAAVDVSPSGEDKKIQAKQRSGCYFAYPAKMED